MSNQRRGRVKSREREAEPPSGAVVLMLWGIFGAAAVFNVVDIRLAVQETGHVHIWVMPAELALMFFAIAVGFTIPWVRSKFRR